MYHKRLIDNYLNEWKATASRKPLLLRGARQVGKSSAVRQLALQFEHFVEVNFEENPNLKTLFATDLDPVRITDQPVRFLWEAHRAGQDPVVF